MKNLSFIFVLLSCFILNNGYSKDFWGALAQVESGNNPKAVGDSGKALGIYQIHESYFKDAAEYDKDLRKYNYFDCFNPEISKKVVTAYLSRYCKNGTPEDFARCHNSGPNWKNKKHLTEKYWQKIKKELGKDFKI